MVNLKTKIKMLSCWSGIVNPIPLDGGFTNSNFIVEDAGKKFVVRIGEDNPLLGIMRFNELAANRAAYEAGLSPEVIRAERGVLVIQYIELMGVASCLLPSVSQLLK